MSAFYGSLRGGISVTENEVPVGSPSTSRFDHFLHPTCIENTKVPEFVFPPLIRDTDIMIFGAELTRDAFILSYFVGEDGSVTVVDFCEAEQKHGRDLIDFHMKRFGYEKPNIEFLDGPFSKLSDCKLKEDSFDVVVASSGYCLGPNKVDALSEVSRVLKLGGEFYFRENLVSKKLPKELAENAAIFEEGLSGVFEWNDFVLHSLGFGLSEPHILTSTPVQITDEKVQKLLGKIKFVHAVFRLFKVPMEEDEDEADNCMLATYEGGIAGYQDEFPFDNAFSFKKGEVLSIGSSLGKLITVSRYKPFFTLEFVDPDRPGSLIDAASLDESKPDTIEDVEEEIHPFDE